MKYRVCALRLIELVLFLLDPSHVSIQLPLELQVCTDEQTWLCEQAISFSLAGTLDRKQRVGN